MGIPAGEGGGWNGNNIEVSSVTIGPCLLVLLKVQTVRSTDQGELKGKGFICQLFFHKKQWKMRDQ